MAYNNSRNPLRALQNRIGEEVCVRLKDGTEYKGKLKEYDNFMNLILNESKEIFKEEITGSYEEIFIRGNNVLFIIPTPE